jgi:hypothetical protein
MNGHTIANEHGEFYPPVSLLFGPADFADGGTLLLKVFDLYLVVAL